MKRVLKEVFWLSHGLVCVYVYIVGEGGGEYYVARLLCACGTWERGIVVCIKFGRNQFAKILGTFIYMDKISI